MNARDAMLQRLQRWRDAGWLRALDLALARFVGQLDEGAPASLLLGSALLAQLEGQGHSCLPVAAMAHDAAALLGWPPEALSELADALSDWPPDAGAAALAWQGLSVLQTDPTGGSGSSPLVLAGGNLSLRRYWRLEHRVAQQVLARSRVDAGPSGTFGVLDMFGTAQGSAASGQAGGRVAQQAHARALFAAWFPAASHAGSGPPDVDWQQVACALALRSRLTLITGGPGTGKTYTAARLLAVMQAVHARDAAAAPLRVALAAPTGKAAARLRQSIVTALQALPALTRDANLAAHPQTTAGSAANQAAPQRLDAVPAGTTLHALLGTRPGTRRFTHDAAHLLELDLVIVDEASMVHLEMMAALLDALPPGARLVLLGDRDQLASVEAGAVLGDLCRPPAGYRADTVRWVQDLTGQQLPALAAGAGPDPQAAGPADADADADADRTRASDLAQQTVMLRHSHRFAGPIGALAQTVNRGDGAAALALLRGSGDGEVALLQSPDAATVVRLAIDGRALAGGGHAPGYLACMELLRQGPGGGLAPRDARRPDRTDRADPADAAEAAEAAESVTAFERWARAVLLAFDRCRVLCAVREGPWGVAGLNAAIEQALATRGLLRRHGAWFVGRPVMVTRNDPALGVFNGDIGIVLQPPGHGAGVGEAAALRVYFSDGTSLRSVSVQRLADVDTAFAMTVHKSQGSEFEHVLLVLPDHDAAVLARELVYTGITRARRALTVVGSDPQRLAAATARLTRRVSGLRQQLHAGAAGPPQTWQESHAALPGLTPDGRRRRGARPLP